MSERFDEEDVHKLFIRHKVFTLAELKQALKTSGTMTVFRRLKKLSYLSSYSHSGKFYTLREIPNFDDLGLWSYGDICFSRYGNLLNTIRVLVDDSDLGYTAVELEYVLQVEVKHALLQLFRKKLIERRKISAAYVYLSIEQWKMKSQALLRERREEFFNLGSNEDIVLLPDELRAAIILFFSLMDEKQRRLYSGLESARLGYGGDRKIANLFNLDPHTVAKGRRELFTGNIDMQRIRKPGAGRKEVEKKLQK